MGRMLNALKQIELREPHPSRAAQPDAPGPPAETSPQEADEAVAIAQQSPREAPPAPARDSAAIEALLAETETATAEALAEAPADATEAPERTDSADAAEPTDPAASDSADPPCPSPEAGLARGPSRKQGTFPDPLSELAERVLHAMPPAPASILFTSPDSNSLAIDLLVPLAMSLAQRVDSDLLLIDANLRRPALAARLGVEASRGLSDVLSGSVAWQDAVRRTVMPGVDLLPAVPFSTPAGSSPDRLHLERLLSETGERYPLVLVHASSLEYPEAAPLALQSGGVYLVVRLHATMRRAAVEAASLLRRSGANLIGCVVVE